MRWKAKNVDAHSQGAEEMAGTKSPVGEDHSDSTTFAHLVDIGRDLWSDCVNSDQEYGWHIAGRDNSIAVAFWAVDSQWDQWLVGGRWPDEPDTGLMLPGQIGGNATAGGLQVLDVPDVTL